MALCFAIFLFFFGMAFWILLFLSGFVGLWVHWGLIAIVKANLAKRGIINMDEIESEQINGNGFEKTLPKKTKIEIKTLNSKEKLIPLRLPREKTHQISELKTADYYGFGLSVQGKSHKKNPPIPCQDFHVIGTYEDKYHYVIVSDGAGSAENSHVGSKIACESLSGFTKKYLANADEETIYNLDSAKRYKIAYRLFEKTREELLLYSKANNVAFETLKCTLILIIQTPNGILSANVGDGRAGCLSEGKYHSLMVPFQTFVVGSTIFLTKEYWDQFLRTSTYDIKKPEAFFVISDGCDDFSFSLKGEVPEKEQGVYDKVHNEARYDHNQPFAGFYDALIGQMKELILAKKEKDITNVAEEIIDLGIFKGKAIEGIQKEDDDKTMAMFLLNKQ